MLQKPVIIPRHLYYEKMARRRALPLRQVFTNGIGGSGIHRLADDTVETLLGLGAVPKHLVTPKKETV